MIKNMKYIYNWLKELSGTKLSPEKAADVLTMHAFELEGLEKAGQEFEGVAVGKILEVKKHPNADKLQIARVDVGGAQPLRTGYGTPPLSTGEGDKDGLLIVCGAPNIAVGQKVPVALVGAKLPNGTEIKATEIRGEKSFGMLCAKDELGLGEDHSGILILDKSAKVGQPLAQYFGEADTVFEIKVLPDRAHDAMSHVGVAREMAALEGKKFDYDFDELKLSAKKSKKLSVVIKDKKLCPRYIGTVMENVEIKPSPEWMQDRLKTCGIKAINNVVDATNYVMLELGQPMHAFDAEQIQNHKNKKSEIVVRRAKDKEKLVLLDDSEIILDENDLLITNGETPLALAGIMGGKDSGINENTKTIVLEAANFHAINIRKSRSRLNIKTESSDRFEKDIDPNLAEKAMVRIIEILEHTANAKLEGVVDIYPNKIKPWKIKLDLEYVNSLLGENVTQKEIVKILNSINIHPTVQPNKVVCEIPTYRIDLKTQEDLIEEIGRLRGYEKIQPQALLEPVEPAKKNEQVFFERQLKNTLANFGFDEMYNYSFYSNRDAEICGLGGIKHYEIANPMNPDQELVRASLIPNLLKNVRQNLKHFESFNLFEIGRVYYPQNNQAEEKRMLVAASVLEKDKDADSFYSMKSAVENLLESLGIKGVAVSFAETKSAVAHPGRVAEVKIYNHAVGMISEVNPAVLAKYKITKRVAMAEIDLEKLLAVLPKTKKYHPINKFPSLTRDISMIVPETVTYGEIEKLTKKIGGQLIDSVSLFDFFKAKQSLAIRITLAAKDKTLESVEVEKVMEKIISSLEKELKVEVRK